MKKDIIYEKNMKKDAEMDNIAAIHYKRPVSYQELTDKQFDAIIERGLNDYQEGRVYTTEEVFNELDKI